MDISRQHITQNLVDTIRALPYSVACWEGGSAATGTLDKYSDLDLVICVENSRVENCFSEVEKSLNAISRISHVWRITEPTWNGHSQCLYQLEGTPDYFFLDIVIMQESKGQRFSEVERHGKPVVFFDKKNFVKESSADPE